MIQEPFHHRVSLTMTSLTSTRAETSWLSVSSWVIVGPTEL